MSICHIGNPIFPKHNSGGPALLQQRAGSKMSVEPMSFCLSLALAEADAQRIPSETVKGLSWGCLRENPNSQGLAKIQSWVEVPWGTVPGSHFPQVSSRPKPALRRIGTLAILIGTPMAHLPAISPGFGADQALRFSLVHREAGAVGSPGPGCGAQ